jgi:hypothetical protein
MVFDVPLSYHCREMVPPSEAEALMVKVAVPPAEIVGVVVEG